MVALKLTVKSMSDFDTFTAIMEPSQKEPVQPPGNNRDIDLGFVFYKTGQALKQFLYFIIECLRNFLRVIIMFLVLLKKNIIWLALGCVAGLGYGIYRNAGASAYQYSSTATVRMNFGSIPSLYSSVDYLNALIGERDHTTLAKIFGISNDEASMLVDFEASPVKSDLAAVELYNNQFLKRRRSDLIRADSFWTKAIPFQDFKSNLTKYDYPLQEVKARSTNARIFPRLQQGLINFISQQEGLQQNKMLVRKATDDEEALLQHSLQNLDTLSDAYVKRLSQHDIAREGTVSNFVLPDRLASRVPELDLYDKMLLIKDELATVREKAVLNREIVQVYSPFYETGEKKNVLIVDIVKMVFYGWAIATIIVLLVILFKYLGKISTESIMKS